jgi:hypothetical protein
MGWMFLFNLSIMMLSCNSDNKSIVIDEETLDKWSAPYRGWYYYPEPVIPSDFRIPGHEDFQSFDVPTVFQLPGQPEKWFMSFIGFNGYGYIS